MSIVEHTGVIVPVPAVDVLTRGWRERYDPSGRVGLVAHVTLLGPLMARAQIGESMLRELAALFRPFPPFDVTFRRTARFADTLYVVPEPDEPFCAMTKALVDRWPEHPPYGGAFAEVTPHLTVAHGEDEETLVAVRAELDCALPFPATVREAHLIAGSNDEGWTCLAAVPLGSGDAEDEVGR